MALSIPRGTLATVHPRTHVGGPVLHVSLDVCYNLGSAVTTLSPRCFSEGGEKDQRISQTHVWGWQGASNTLQAQLNGDAG